MAVKVFAALAYKNWKEVGHDDAKQKGLAMMKRMSSDQVFAAETGLALQNLWRDCDANGDGKMDKEEYRVFHTKLLEMQS